VNAPNPPSPSQPPRRSHVEHTKWSPGLLGFYASCAGVSLGAAIAFGSWFFFHSQAGLVFGCVMSGVSCITCYFALRAARRPPSPSQ
jgi:hypothetical protein